VHSKCARSGASRLLLVQPVVDTLARRVFGDAGAFLNLAFKLFALAGNVFAQSERSDRDVKDDVKEAGRSTKRAAKKTGHKLKRGTKRAAHKAAQKTRQGADRAEDKTEPQ